jgi:putative DNA methylase
MLNEYEVHAMNLLTRPGGHDRRKLIETVFPLEAVNETAAREKSLRPGHPSSLHQWWARRPIGAARAVLFASIVDDPGGEGVPPELLDEIDRLPLQPRYSQMAEGKPGEDEAERLANVRRARLFGFIDRLASWESMNDGGTLEAARRLIRAAAGGDPPGVHDPFAGGGTIPLEARRLGLEAVATDLNPVAVAINRANLEIPSRFAGLPPVNPESRRRSMLDVPSRGAQGLAEDVRYYGQWMRDEAERRLGHLYPKVEVTEEMAAERPDLKPYLGKELTVIAWIWARTVKSPNPAFRDVEVPLASTFMLSTKPGKEAYVEPVVEGGDYRFTVKAGKPNDLEAARNGTTAGKRAAFRCLMSGVMVTYDHIRAEGKAGRMGSRLMAIVAEGERKRVYLPPTPEQEEAARLARPSWRPDVPVNSNKVNARGYGFGTWADLFAPRQLEAAGTFAELVGEAMEMVRRDAVEAGMPDDPAPLREGGAGAAAYAEAVGVFLAFAVDKLVDYGSTACHWNSSSEKAGKTHSRTAVPMIWHYAEQNPLCRAVGGWRAIVEWLSKSVAALPGTGPAGRAVQADASSQAFSSGRIVSTDPPYYDTVQFAELSDYFHVWLRRTLGGVYPDLFSEDSVPKAQELVAAPHRHGGRESARIAFLEGMERAMRRIAEQAHPDYPITVYYAFKQARGEGWKPFMESVDRAGLAVVRAWPLRTESGNRLNAISADALTSSVVLVLRRRDPGAPELSRREFRDVVRREMAREVRELQRLGIPPVDLRQAAIGAGMAMWGRHSRIVGADGERMAIGEAVEIANEALDEALAEQDREFDPVTQWAIAYYGKHCYNEAPESQAESVSAETGVPVPAAIDAGIAWSYNGLVRLAPGTVMDYDVERAAVGLPPTAWAASEIVSLAWATDGDSGAARALRRMRASAPQMDYDSVRRLAYRLYSIAERNRWSGQAQIWNAIGTRWSAIVEASAREA